MASGCLIEGGLILFTWLNYCWFVFMKFFIPFSFEDGSISSRELTNAE